MPNPREIATANAQRRAMRELPSTRPTSERGQYVGPATLGRNEPCPCVSLGLPEAASLPPHKVKRHDALYGPIRRRIYDEQAAKILAAQAASEPQAARVMETQPAPSANTAVDATDQPNPVIVASSSNAGDTAPVGTKVKP